jgi:hypothetical protein
MGLDVTILRADGEPLGHQAEVQQMLVSAFPELVLTRSLSGAEKIREAEAKGIEFPPFIKEQMEMSPPVYEGDLEKDNYSIEFYFTVDPVVQEMNATIRGSAGDAQLPFERALARLGWMARIP